MKCRVVTVVLRHCAVEVMTFIVFTISGFKGGFKIFFSIADFIKIRYKKLKVVIQLTRNLLRLLQVSIC